jgi:hypothetical protein
MVLPPKAELYRYLSIRNIKGGKAAAKKLSRGKSHKSQQTNDLLYAGDFLQLAILDIEEFLKGAAASCAFLLTVGSQEREAPLPGQPALSDVEGASPFYILHFFGG